jgi:transcription factor WhiB
MLTRQTQRHRLVPTTGPVPLGPGNPDVDFFTHGACTHPDVDPDLFTCDEEDHQAVAAARVVCRDCPVRLACRSYAYQANPYGVYAAETRPSAPPSSTWVATRPLSGGRGWRDPSQ